MIKAQLNIYLKSCLIFNKNEKIKLFKNKKKYKNKK